MSYRYLNFSIYNQDLQYLFLAHVDATVYLLKMHVHIPIVSSIISTSFLYMTFDSFRSYEFLLKLW